MMLRDIAGEILEFEGVTRKKPIANVLDVFRSVSSEYANVVVDFGDDAAAIDIGGDDLILFAADGIWDRLVKASPYHSGYVSVLVNVNDIAAMGGHPVAMVNVLSTDNDAICNEMLRGMRDGVAKFGVPMVGGHLHPDTPYASLAVAIIGTVKKDCIIRSDTARSGDVIIMAIDLDGRIGKNSPYSFDSTTHKSPAHVRALYRVMEVIGERKLATAGKDISNPGSLGTLGMLLETSGVGASVEIDRIPAPADVDFVQWLKVHPGTGFVVTVKPENRDECIRLFNDAGYTVSAVGEINDSLALDIVRGDERVTLFDFKKDSVTGIAHDKL